VLQLLGSDQARRPSLSRVRCGTLQPAACMLLAVLRRAPTDAMAPLSPCSSRDPQHDRLAVPAALMLPVWPSLAAVNVGRETSERAEARMAGKQRCSRH
jgi:hypothetical protein